MSFSVKTVVEFHVSAVTLCTPKNQLIGLFDVTWVSATKIGKFLVKRKFLEKVEIDIDKSWSPKLVCQIIYQFWDD